MPSPNETVRLTRAWTLGERLGSGGFGAVFAATGDDGTRAAAKFVPKAPGSERELLFVDLGGARNVVPVIDSGEHDDEWVLVMPRAEGSLADRLDAAAGPLPATEALAVLRDVATALVDLDGLVVHRDIKPDNVLRHEGAWCLADFGIARYAEAATSSATRKHALTPAYAAPERWRDEHATIATDVYAVGVVAHELLTGGRPFPGPHAEDYRRQHLSADPPPLPGVDVRLATLVTECLFKQPGARPTPTQLAARLDQVELPAATPGASALAAAYARHTEASAANQREASVAQSEQERRVTLMADARRAHAVLSDALLGAVKDGAPGVTVTERTEGWSAQLGQAKLGLSTPKAFDGRSWGSWEAPAFDVIAFATVTVVTPSDRSGYEGRSHSLYFGDLHDAGRYAWFETAFMVTPLMMSARRGQDPFARHPGEDAAKAFWRGMAEFQVAWPVMPVVLTELGEFVDRWIGWFAAAADGQLSRPTQMPERPAQDTWRH